MSRPGVGRDDRGAMMLICVFFAVFAVSMLYLAIGAGEAVLFRENLQDAADAAALSGAVTHARMMNVLVLINLVMAALLAILVAIKLVESLAIVGIALALGAAFFTGGATLAAVPPLKALQGTMHSLYEELKTPIFDVLELLHDVGDTVSEIGPEVAQTVAQAELHESEGDVVESGFSAITAKTLPVDDDRYEYLCEKSGELIETIAKKPFESIDPLADVIGLVLEPLSVLTGALSKWFCGDGSNSVPDITRYVDKGYPRPPSADACENDENVPNPGDETSLNEITSQACKNADQEKERAKPNSEGNCVNDCGPNGAFEQAVAQARSDCDPSRAPRPTAYRYQLQDKRVEYEWTKDHWVKGEPEVVRSQLIESAGAPPCGAEELSPSIGVGYNLKIHPEGDGARVLPVCARLIESEPTAREQYSTTNEEPRFKTVEYQQVTHIFGCKRREQIPVPVTNDKSPGKGGDNSKSPKRVNGDTKLGDEEFQFRSIAVGDLAQRESARLVRLGLWGRSDPDNPLEGRRTLGGFAVAQAEYFYDGEGDLNDRGPWMWNMMWRGRLKRVALPQDDDSKTRLLLRCTAFVGVSDCNRMLGIVDDWKELIGH